MVERKKAAKASDRAPPKRKPSSAAPKAVAKKTKTTHPAKAVVGSPPMLHPFTSMVLARSTNCNKPLVMYRKESGSWLECFLQADCSYGGCTEIDESQVPDDAKG